MRSRTPPRYCIPPKTPPTPVAGGRFHGGKALLLLFSLVLTKVALPADPSQRYVFPDRNGTLVYERDERGNRVPDFSFAGYRQGFASLPQVETRAIVAVQSGDATVRIQSALDEVARRAIDSDGFRGAVLLRSGQHEVSGRLRIRASGVVLRGESGTVLVAKGISRDPVLLVSGRDDQTVEPAIPIADSYVPVGSTKLTLVTSAGLQPGNTIEIHHPSTEDWIRAVGMNRFPSRDGKGSWQDWKPGTLDLRCRRRVVEVQGPQITLDVPLTQALDRELAPASVARFRWPGQISDVGIEGLRMESDFDRSNPRDELHAWDAIVFSHVRNGWVRDVNFAHFAGSAVHVQRSAEQVTVQNCRSERPVSERGGYRRHTFYTAGQMTLFDRCVAEDGRHDFAVGYLACGPNVFVDCEAVRATGMSGPIESWATGVLYDNVVLDGGELALTNRETAGHGVGWAAASSLLWQCTAPVITCRNPPTAKNWSIGCWGEFVGHGEWRSMNEFQTPRSLFWAQRGERSPRPPVPENQPDADGSIEPAVPLRSESAGRLVVQDGWLRVGKSLLAGSRVGTQWWRGHLLPQKAQQSGLGVTRFVPGQQGHGYSDDLELLTNGMLAAGQVVLEHHWGLWYDRRRDDHQMVRRSSSDVWPPFLELPWARSGKGTAWDGLSRYDLSRFNAWYFARLAEFAQLCRDKQLVLFQQMYFQHNLLEAGAHWADFPWRPANCLQATGFPEPPPYENRKRIHLAEQFYDVTHPVRRALHRQYIRHCLDVLGRRDNVIFFIGEEFTGPLPFVQFWLDTIAEWQVEHDRRVLVGLACTKDVQDAILADREREPLIAVIDMKYWWYTANGGIFDPPGDARLAPRQQQREWKGSVARSGISIARQISEYRRRFPAKAIIHALEPADPWLVLAAGGSIPQLPETTDPALLKVFPTLQPTPAAENSSVFILAGGGHTYLVAAGRGPVQLVLPSETGSFSVFAVNAQTGQTPATPLQIVRGGQNVELSRDDPGIWFIQKH